MKEKPNGRCVKCPHCEEYELMKDKDNMHKVEVGKINRYLHKECYNDFMFSERIKQKDAKLKEQLGDYIKKVHSIKKIPQNFWFLIEDIRNGTERFQQRRKIKNKSKEGYNYDVILKSYQLKISNIKWSIANKDFDHKIGEMIYCLRIVENYLIEADQKLKKEKRRKKIVDLHEQRQREEKVQVEQKRVVEYKQNEYKHDILDLFE